MAKVLQNQSGSVCGINNSGFSKLYVILAKAGIQKSKLGFSLLEILIALLIVGLMGAIIIPNLTGRTARYEREAFVSNLNRLVQLGWQQALITNTLHKVVVNFEQNTIWLEKQEAGKDKELFVPLKGTYTNTSVEIPPQLKFKQFFIEGQNELGRFAGRATKDAWFFILPDGTTQSVVVNMIDMKDKKNNKPRPVSLRLNPFSAQFSVYDEFQNP